jgi:hypothetical protein
MFSLWSGYRPLNGNNNNNNLINHYYSTAIHHKRQTVLSITISSLLLFTLLYHSDNKSSIHTDTVNTTDESTYQSLSNNDKFSSTTTSNTIILNNNNNNNDPEDIPTIALINPNNNDLANTKQCLALSRRKEHPGIGNNSPRVIYVHIPKAGGTSIQIAMRGWVDKTANGVSSYMIANGPSFSHSSFTCPPGALGHNVLAGHRGFGYCTEIENNPRGMFTFTAFREPVARAVSLHDYNLITIGDSKDSWEDAFKDEKESLSDSIKRFNRTQEIERGEALLRFAGSQQTRFMCGYACLGPNVRGNDTYTNEYMLKKAKVNLLKLDAVGVSERLDELIPQLKLHLSPLVPRGFSKWPESNAQTPKKKSVLDNEARAILAKWSETDAELYKIADEIARKKTEEARKCGFNK